MFTAIWEIYTNRKMGYTKKNKKEFFILQEAEDFLYRKKDSIKEENWIKGEVVETLYQVYLKI